MTRSSRSLMAAAFSFLWLLAPQPLPAQEPATTVELLNGSMEQIERDRPAGWRFSGPEGFTLSVDSENAFAGQSCAVITAAKEPPPRRCYVRQPQPVI